MPPANQVKNSAETLLIRVLLYGAEKTKKSWWMLNGGFWGFNVLYFDIEKSVHIIKNVDEAALKRTLIVDLKDETDNAISSKFITKFLRGAEFLWDECCKLEVNVGGKPHPQCSHILFNASKLTANDMVCMDSYTEIVRSTRDQDAKALGIDIANGAGAVAAKDSGQMRDIYHADGIGLSWILNACTKLPCHFGMIGHRDVYEIHDPKDRAKLLDVRRQIKSSSGPHAATIGNQFSDILFFELLGTAFMIDTSAHQSRMGGCRIIPPKSYKWDELQFVDYCKLGNYPRPSDDLPPSEGFVWFPPGELPESYKPKEQKPLPSSPASKTTIAVGGQIKPSGSLTTLNRK